MGDIYVRVAQGIQRFRLGALIASNRGVNINLGGMIALCAGSHSICFLVVRLVKI